MVVSPDTAVRAQTLLADHQISVTSPSTAVVLDSGVTYTCVATVTGIRCSCPAHAPCCHSAAALVAWAAVYQPTADLPWMAGADVFADERRQEMAVTFIEQQTAVWGPGWRG